MRSDSKKTSEKYTRKSIFNQLVMIDSREVRCLNNGLFFKLTLQLILNRLLLLLAFDIQNVVEKSLSFKLLLKRTFLKLVLSFYFNEEFDPSSGLTLAVCLIHASRAPLTLFINFL